MPPKASRHSLASGTGALPAPGSPLLAYSFQDIVLAKVKGHPAWPARVIDPRTAPVNLRDERKMAQKNSYLVRFFKTADYAWMNSREITVLTPTEIRAFINNPNKKGADLKAAYQIALEPDAWEAEMEESFRLEQEQQGLLEYDELENGEEEEMAAVATTTPSQKTKRKRVPTTPKPKVKPAKKRKSELSVNDSAHASPAPEPASTAPVVKKGRKKKEEQAALVDGETTVREWRHKLQRVFLGKVEVSDKVMPDIDQAYTAIENFDMKTEWLTSSKLGKVLKRVGVLEDGKIPLDDKYKIRARSRALQEKWRQTLGIGEELASRSAQSGAAADTKSSSQLVTNGYGSATLEATAPDGSGGEGVVGGKLADEGKETMVKPEKKDRNLHEIKGDRKLEHAREAPTAAEEVGAGPTNEVAGHLTGSDEKVASVTSLVEAASDKTAGTPCSGEGEDSGEKRAKSCLGMSGSSHHKVDGDQAGCSDSPATGLVDEVGKQSPQKVGLSVEEKASD